MRRNRMLIGISIMALVLGAFAVGLTSAAEKECCEDGCTPTAENWAEFLEANDADGDGMISRDEFPGQPQAFARVDADGDGQITQQEAAEAVQTHQMRQGQRGRLQGAVDPQARWERLVEHHDADGNGVISREEFGGPEHAFARLDADGDGSLTQDEVLTAAPRMTQQGAAEGGARRGQGDPAARWQRMLEQLDADGNGTISQAEFLGPDEAFARIDADGDGQITQEEAATMAGRRRGGAGLGQGHRAPQA